MITPQALKENDENIAPNQRPTRRLGESTYDYLTRKTKEDLERVLGTNLTQVQDFPKLKKPTIGRFNL